MSHFSVLVIGDDVEGQLAPYHEFECTGLDDQYVEDIDETDEKRAEYAHSTTTMLRAPDGGLHEPYADEFFREMTDEERAHFGGRGLIGTGWGNGIHYSSKDWGDGRGYRAKVQFVPDGYEEVTVPYSEAMTFPEYLHDYHGITLVDADLNPVKGDSAKYGYAVVEGGEVTKVIRRTNPNRKWDWWVLGGRWRGFFWVKPGATAALGALSSYERVYGEHSQPSVASDQARKGDIDWEAMRQDAAVEARKSYLDFTREGAGHAFLYGVRMRPEVQARLDALPREEARATYQDLTLADFETEEEYVARLVRRNGITFAVVKDGEWYERGEMGWWGAVSVEVDEEEWDTQFRRMIDELPDDTLLSVVDCHV